MAMKQGIITDINAYMKNSGGAADSTWYVGIAADPEARLFSDHSVVKHGAWIYRTADSAAIAREIEKEYLDAGTDGGTGGGDASTRAVYAYKKTATTRP